MPSLCRDAIAVSSVAVTSLVCARTIFLNRSIPALVERAAKRASRVEEKSGFISKLYVHHGITASIF